MAYHVAVNGQATGPFNLAVLQQMAAAGQFVAGSLVWKAGMAEWSKAETVDELKDIFANIPPVPPTEQPRKRPTPISKRNDMILPK